MDAVEVLFEIACSIKLILQSDFDEIEQLKEGEVRCIVPYLLPKDVFAVLPTGFGKLIIFQMIPSVCSLLSARLSKRCNPCNRLSVGFSNQFPCRRYLTLFQVRATIREK